tara:strand:- start:528 stop:755 length:228 start_codon:yes stop_codon:yes gene_type:complete
MKYINVKVFLISLFVGLFLNYITLTPPKVIVIYPTQDNFNKIQLKDKTDTCFNIKSQEVLCSDHKDDIQKVPYQN